MALSDFFGNIYKANLYGTGAMVSEWAKQWLIENPSVPVPGHSQNSKKDTLFGQLDNQSVALKNRAIFFLQPPALVDMNGNSSVSRGSVMTAADVARALPLFSMIDANHPSGQIGFKSNPNAGFGVTAELEQYENLQITYWDLENWTVTKRLYEFYNAQIAADGLLEKNYNKLTISMFADGLTRIYLNCAISMPQPTGFSASMGLQTFKVSFAYDNFTESSEDELLLDSFLLGTAKNPLAPEI